MGIDVLGLVFLVAVLVFVASGMWGPWRGGWRFTVGYQRAPGAGDRQHRVLLRNDFDAPVGFHRFELVRSKKRSTGDMIIVSDTVEGGSMFTVEPRDTRVVVFRGASDWAVSDRPWEYGKLFVRIWPDRRSEPLWYRLEER
jgi:hypothetical protein